MTLFGRLGKGGAALALSFVLGASVEASAADRCFPAAAPQPLIGKYFVYASSAGRGPEQLRTAVIAGASDAGGLLTCFYDGRPGRLGPLRRILATDADYNFAWSINAKTGQRREASPQQRACDLGLGRCEVRQTGTPQGRPIRVAEFDRRCENGAFVKVRTNVRFEGGGRLVRNYLNQKAAQAATRSVEIAYRADGAILRSSVRNGGGSAVVRRLVDEGVWTGPTCAPGLS